MKRTCIPPAVDRWFYERFGVGTAAVELRQATANEVSIQDNPASQVCGRASTVKRPLQNKYLTLLETMEHMHVARFLPRH
jgi:hypothetical protein